MKKKFTIIGNCQVDSILPILNLSDDFSQNYEYVRVPPVHTISPELQRSYIDKISALDLVIQQPIVDKIRFPFLTNDAVYNIVSGGCKVINIPSAYYTGYFPTFDSLDGINGTINGVHDYQILSCYLKGASQNETFQYINDYQGLSTEQIVNQHTLSIQNLHKRELVYNLDVKLSSFIIDNFQSKSLFHTFNHPTSETIRYIVNEILSLCSVTDKVEASNTEFLNHIILPINKKIKSALGLKFDQKHFVKNNKEISLKELIQMEYQVYRGYDTAMLGSLRLKKKKFLLNS
jgi:hypothetical protein